jgi:hypothetical protein
MAQSDMNIANQGFPAFRADLNAALAALVSNSSGATAPSATFPHQFWVDTSASPSVLKQRNLNDDAWVTIGEINEATGTFKLVDGAVVVDIADITGLQAALDDKANQVTTYTKTEVDAFAVKLTGNQTVAGVKTFSSDPVMGVSALTGDIAAARITNALNASGSAPVYACRAWVNFNGTTSPGTIRGSGNVSSVVRNGTGDYTINFTTAMPDGNYAVGLGNGGTAAGWLIRTYDEVSARTTSFVRVLTANDSGTSQNQSQIGVSVFR